MDHNRIITTNEEHICDLIDRARQGHTVRMIGIGKSMHPLLEDGRDYIDLIAVNNDTELKKNDVIFYKSHEGKYVLHRIYSLSEEGYFPNGDGNLTVEPLLDRENIYLKAVGFIRNGKYVSIHSKWYRCYARVWTRLLPLRAFILRWRYRYIKVIMILKGRKSR